MQLSQIPSILKDFSIQHDLYYDDSPLPFIPFGGVSGIYKGFKAYVYIKNSESTVARRHLTVFGLSDKGIFPRDFKIEYYGNPNKDYTNLKNLVSIIGQDNLIFDKFINKVIEEHFVEAFKKIDEIDENLFGVRSSTTFDEDGFTLVSDDIFGNLEQLDVAFRKVLNAFIELNRNISSNM